MNMLLSYPLPDSLFQGRLFDIPFPQSVYRTEYHENLPQT